MTQQPPSDRWRPESQHSYLAMVAYCQMSRSLRSQFDPEDAAQQTEMQAWEKRHQFRGTTDAEYRGWLRAILINVLREWVRKNKPARALREWEESSKQLEKSIAGKGSTPLEQLMRDEELARLAAALAELLPAERQAIQLRHLDGLRSAEIAQQMGRTPNAVAGLLRRGLKRLRQAR